MFLILGINVGEFDNQKCYAEFVFSSNGFLDSDSEFNQLFIEFIFLATGFQLQDLAPTIQYVAYFMALPFNYELPIAAQGNDSEKRTHKELLSFQTYHPMSQGFVEQKINNSPVF